MKISIIIPVYNAEKYLSRCIESVLKCESKDIELILVNDGSKDCSKEICELYIQKDKRVNLINQVNKGVSIARNNGIQVATGDYIMFLDADDYLVNDYFKIISDTIIKNYDFIGFSNYSVNKNKISRDDYPNVDIYSEDLNDAYQILMGTHLLHTCWGKLYKRELIIKQKIKFPKSVKIGEDYLFVLEFFKYIKNIKLVNTPILYYYINDGSVMQDNYNAKLRYDTWKDLTSYCLMYYRERKFNFDSIFYRYLFKNTTSFLYNLFQKTDNKISWKYTEYISNNLVWKYILKNIDITSLSLLKKIEYYIFSSGKIWLIFIYFKLKSRLKKYN